MPDMMECLPVMQEPTKGLAKVQDFLEQVALWSEPEKYSVDDSEDGVPDVVNVMTLHLSKGLEFHTVFIVGRVHLPTVAHKPVRRSHCSYRVDLTS